MQKLMKLRQNLTKIIRKVVAYVDFSTSIIQVLSISNINFTYETDQLHNHSQSLLQKLSESPNF